MRLLQVEDFSCINSASLELGKLTLIIGPQAGGKSVLCKLCYFFLDTAQTQFSSLVRQESYEKFVAGLKERFLQWFPMSAWGHKQFKISLSAGEYSISVSRKIWKGKPQADCRVKLSPAFKSQYEALLAEASKISAKKPGLTDRFELEYKFREVVLKSLKELMQKDSISSQAFVPAGRSFFTSIGKAIAAFEQGNVLDPLILRFGRMYTAYKDRPGFMSRYERTSEGQAARVAGTILLEILGGKPERDGEKEHILTQDGRQVPLSALSSGQQELLPLLTVLPWLVGAREDRLFYIEEPEAHLFPTAQSKLIEALVVAASGGANLVLTTHSPYVVAKVNNLLKAGALGRKASDALRKELDTITNRRAWLSARQVRAYAIKDGCLSSILGKDGLIDADYLDEVSGHLSEEFSKYLEMEESLGQ